jgi:glutamate-1-semialdehyde 2,1-aminomutase
VTDIAADARGTASEEMLREAARYIPGGVNSGRRNTASKICIREGHGSRIVEVDGREYVDFHASYGAIFLGHALEEVNRRVAEVVKDGVLFGLGVGETELELARRIVQHVPSADQVLFCNSGSEATYHASRVMRAATGRRKLIRFGGTYHGWQDEFYPTAGSLEYVSEQTLRCRFNDLEHVEETLRAHSDQVAGVVVEPVIHNAPGGCILPQPGFLEGLRALCDREGVILLFDEVITGFRHALGGYQSICGVTPDLTTMAKAIANGYPLAAIAGKRELMELYDTNDDGIVAMGGTYNGSRTVVAAGLACVELMEREPVHEHVFALGQRMRDGLTEIVERAGIAAHAGGFGSLFVLSFFETPARNHEDVLANDTELFLAYRRQMVARGFFEIPENVGRSHLSWSHTHEDVDRALEAAEESLRAALEERAARK